MLLAVGTLCLMAGCSSKMSSSKGIVSDATMNMVTIVTDKNDTLSFSTMDANKEEVNGLLLNDTLEVFYTGKYTPGMPASKLVQYPQSPLVGGDRDEHGCIGSAGYVWSEVKKDCIRPFEAGLKISETPKDNATYATYIVFAADSVQAELYTPESEGSILLERADNQWKNDTISVSCKNGQWSISKQK